LDGQDFSLALLLLHSMRLAARSYESQCLEKLSAPQSIVQEGKRRQITEFLSNSNESTRSNRVQMAPNCRWLNLLILVRFR
jgi:hypothetical protein